MLKIEDLKVGDVVVNKESGAESIVLSISLKFSHIYVGDGRFILSKNFTYFKKKEQSQYTFDDLIDIAVQANNDCVINGFYVAGEKLNCQTLDGEDYNLGIGCEVAHGIKYLQSLYKETFVIESEEDIKRIKCYSTITLANGNTIKVKELCKYGVEYSRLSIVYRDENYHLTTHTILELKGATVEQSK